MSCPAERRPPTIAYLLFDAHPAMTIPRTVSALVRSRAAPETRSGLTEFARRSLPAPSVATWREERFAQRVSRERFLEEDAPKVGVPVELNAEHVVGLALAPVRALPHTAERGNVRVELGAGRAQHHEDLRHGAPHEGDRTKLAAGVDAGIHRVQVAPCEGIVADEPSDLDEVRAIDVEDEHVVKGRRARLLAEPRRDVGANRCEVDRRPRRAQYQLSASFFHAW